MNRDGLMIAVSATNPCHLYEMALELYKLGVLNRYYSGYPRWKLNPPPEFPMVSSSLRTLAVYGALRFAPRCLKPSPQRMFRWQDDSFDRAVARMLCHADFIHAMPGQCQKTFQAAKGLGIRTVLNHATGPVRQQLAAVAEEYRRFGLKQENFHFFNDTYFAREAREYSLADYHCVASSVVQEQLVAEGVDKNRIWVIPYGADPAFFYPGQEPMRAPFTIAFAGQICLRKGIQYLLEALQSDEAKGWKLEGYGVISHEMESILPKYQPTCQTIWHGAISRFELGKAFRKSSVLVLPSLEEGFGLVVPQALACGIPCIVSDRTGAKDLIRHRDNGSIVPTGDAGAILKELCFWYENPKSLKEDMSWRVPGLKMREISEGFLV